MVEIDSRFGYDPIIRDIPGYPNYQISENGEVYNKINGRELAYHSAKNFYILCALNRTPKQVHKLLALAFILNPENKKYIDHIDRNRINNKLSNLRWATNSENMTNKTKQKNNKSGVVGVFKTTNNGHDKWKVKIMKNKIMYSQYFDYTDEGFEKAKEWREQKEIELFGEFRRT